MRRAVEDAYQRITGFQSEFNFSGWGGTLNAVERAVFNDDDDAALAALSQSLPAKGER